MLVFRKLILLFFLHFVLEINLYSKTSSIENADKYNESFEIYFARGNFQQSLFNLFQLVHYYKQEADTNKLFLTWNRISVVHFLLGKNYQGDAAMDISRKYKANKYKDYGFLSLAYKKFFIYGKVVRGYSDFYPDTTDGFITKSKKNLDFCILLNTNKEKEIEMSTYAPCLQLLDGIRQSKDTLWFGFANINFYLGSYLFNRKEFALSLFYFLAAKDIYIKNLQFNYELINTYNYLKSIDYSLNTNKKLEYYNELTYFFNKGLISKQYLYFYYICKGEYFYVFLNFDEAVNSFLEALKYTGGLKSREKYLSSRIIEIYYNLNNYAKVIEWFNKTRGTQLPDYNVLIAYSYFKLGKKDIATYYIHQIIKGIRNKTEFKYNAIYGWLANYFFESGDFHNAELYYTKYLKGYIKCYGNFHQNTALAYSSLAYFEWEGKGNIAAALYFYHHEICSLTQSKFTNNIFSVPDISGSINDEYLAKAIQNKSEALYELSKSRKTMASELKYLKAAMQGFELSLKVVTNYKFSLLGEEHKLVYTELTKHYFPFIIQTCIDLYQKTGDKYYIRKTFEYIEKSKASMLLSMMRGAGARRMDLIPGKWIQKEEEIRINTQKILQNVSNENKKVTPDNAIIDRYNTELDQIKQQQDSLLYLYKVQYPEYYKICYKNEVVGIDSLQKLIHPNQAVVQYSVSEKMLVVILITKDTVEFRRESIGSSFFAKVEQYRKAVTGFQFSDTRFVSIQAYQGVANSLYQILLQPFEKLFNGKELIIIPDDVLNLIPFESLVTSKLPSQQKMNYRDLNYLIRKSSLGYNYSASLFAYTRTSAINNLYPARLLALAPSGFIYDKSSLSKINSDEETRFGESIAPIPGSVEEAKAAHHIFHGKLLLQKEATESEFKRLASQYSIIHLASHGIVDNKNPLLSKILFAPEKDSLNDGFLNTWEVYSLQLHAPLVVLSACNTGFGKLYKGEGIISLARSFFLAGSQNVVMTLWSVADKTSNQLMQNFYMHLSGSETINGALQNAKMDYLTHSDKMSAHPYFWAGYVSIGNPNIRFEKPPGDYSYWFYSAGLCLLLLGIILAYKKNQRKG